MFLALALALVAPALAGENIVSNPDFEVENVIYSDSFTGQLNTWIIESGWEITAGGTDIGSDGAYAEAFEEVANMYQVVHYTAEDSAAVLIGFTLTTQPYGAGVAIYDSPTRPEIGAKWSDWTGWPTTSPFGRQLMGSLGVSGAATDTWAYAEKSTLEGDLGEGYYTIRLIGTVCDNPVYCQNDPGQGSRLDNIVVEIPGEFPPSEDADGDHYWASDGDCDDNDATVYPGALELCDGLDNDCDSEVDEDATDAPTWYADLDGDGYGDPAEPLEDCEAPSGYVSNDDDAFPDDPTEWSDTDGDGVGGNTDECRDSEGSVDLWGCSLDDYADQVASICPCHDGWSHDEYVACVDKGVTVLEREGRLSAKQAARVYADLEGLPCGEDEDDMSYR